MSKISLKFYQDPGHGWVAVKRKLLDDLGMKFSISHFSYQKGKTVYLEEDCDASILLETLKARGLEWQLEEKYTDRRHPIRSYEPYHPWVDK